MPPYNANIPQSTDLISTSQGDILANFQALNTFLNVNHVDFSSGNAGMHKFVTLPVQGSSPAVAAGNIALFNKNSSLTTFNELTIINQAGTEYPVTASLPATTGWCYLPSGLLMKWGTLSGNGDSSFAFPVAATIPVFNNVYTAQVTTSFNSASDVDVFVRLTSISTVTIRVYCSLRTTTGAAAASFNYVVIGD